MKLTEREKRQAANAKVIEELKEQCPALLEALQAYFQVLIRERLYSVPIPDFGMWYWVGDTIRVGHVPSGRSVIVDLTPLLEDGCGDQDARDWLWDRYTRALRSKLPETNTRAERVAEVVRLVADRRIKHAASGLREEFVKLIRHGYGGVEKWSDQQLEEYLLTYQEPRT